LFIWLENHKWCQLPRSGGVYDQPAWLWQKLIEISYYKQEWDETHKSTIRNDISSNDLNWLKSVPEDGLREVPLEVQV
jgi:hypothetical protein